MPRTRRADQARVLLAATAEKAERVSELAITEEPGKSPEVAISLAGESKPRGFPDLAPGDRLLALAEVEVTTDCTPEQRARAKRNEKPCFRQPYDYQPQIRAGLLLAGDEREVGNGAGWLDVGHRQRLRPSHAEHHRVLVISGARVEIPHPKPRWLDSPHLNLVLDAHSNKAKTGQVVLVGENEPDGTVSGDKGRISVLRIRGNPPRPKRERETAILKRQVPTDRKKHCVLSLRLNDLKGGEQLLVRSLVTGSAAHLEHRARLSTTLLLADDPEQEKPEGRAKEVATFGGEVGKHNGFNCLPGRGPTASRRVGTLHLERDAGKPLYLNLLVDSGNPDGEDTPDEHLRILGNPAYIEVLRFSPELKG